MELAGYSILGVVSSSTSSVVVQARDQVLDRLVALKRVPLADSASVARLRNEASTLARLRHPNIVSVLDVLESDDAMWLVEPWIDGAPVSALLRRTGGLDAPAAMGIGRGTLIGLAHAHGQEIVHGDVTPGNVLVESAGRPMLLDFGIAVPSGSPGVGGTPGFCAPEVLNGDVLTPRSDVYSAAALIAALTSGAKVFVGTSSEEITAAQLAGTPDLSGVSTVIREILRDALSTDPANRPADARDLLASLDEADESGKAGWTGASTAVGAGAAAATIGAGLALIAPRAAEILTGVGDLTKSIVASADSAKLAVDTTVSTASHATSATQSADTTVHAAEAFGQAASPTQTVTSTGGSAPAGVTTAPDGGATLSGLVASKPALITLGAVAAVAIVGGGVFLALPDKEPAQVVAAPALPAEEVLANIDTGPSQGNQDSAMPAGTYTLDVVFAGASNVYNPGRGANSQTVTIRPVCLAPDRPCVSVATNDNGTSTLFAPSPEGWTSVSTFGSTCVDMATGIPTGGTATSVSTERVTATGDPSRPLAGTREVVGTGDCNSTENYTITMTKVN